MADEVVVSAGLVEEMYKAFQTYGVILDDGRSYLTEVTVNIDRFRAVIRPNESQHRGRPHCLIEMGEDSATFDLETGELLAGSLKSWNRTAEKVVKENSAKLFEVWNATRPDDQKLS